MDSTIAPNHNGTTGSSYIYDEFTDFTPTQDLDEVKAEPVKEYFAMPLPSEHEKKRKKEIRRDMRKSSKRLHDRW